MKLLRPGPSMSERIALGFTAAWVIGGFAVGLVEVVSTGQSLLDTGGSPWSWGAGGFIALLTFAGVIAWGRRHSPPENRNKRRDYAQYH